MSPSPPRIGEKEERRRGDGEFASTSVKLYSDFSREPRERGARAV